MTSSSLIGRAGPDRRSILGRAGEELAARHLTGLGMQVLDRNWRCPLGEVDLVLLDGCELVVCEVKTRRSEAYGHPLESITAAKLARLRQLAAIYARGAGQGSRPFDALRIDAIGIVWPRGGAPLLRHLRAVGS